VTDYAPYEAVSWDGGVLRLLDQTLLPQRVEYCDISTLDQAIEAITSMRVRGAPAIGVAAAYALAIIARDGDATATKRAATALAEARPTAVNLRWAVDRVLQRAEADSAPDAALGEAKCIHEEQREADRQMAQFGASLVVPESTLLTHCNTGPLATAGGHGTALGVVIEAHRQGLVAGVLVDETRPRLQGARLTTWELHQHGVPHRLIADSSAAGLMAQGRVDAVFTGADRIAANGDTANKVGTYALAVIAAHHEVAFHIVAPLSTIDPATPDGDAIPIEQRDPSELLAIDGHALAAEGTEALNPAFDVTPAPLIASIVTERGVLRPPFAASIAEALAAPALAGGG
jgi:methylthioribose-1-phosphate isomerase